MLDPNDWQRCEKCGDATCLSYGLCQTCSENIYQTDKEVAALRGFVWLPQK